MERKEDLESTQALTYTLMKQSLETLEQRNQYNPVLTGLGWQKWGEGGSQTSYFGVLIQKKGRKGETTHKNHYYQPDIAKTYKKEPRSEPVISTTALLLTRVFQEFLKNLSVLSHFIITIVLGEGFLFIL